MDIDSVLAVLYVATGLAAVALGVVVAYWRRGRDRERPRTDAQDERDRCAEDERWYRW